jgi:S-formylglutathione hydrolase FrmB
MTDSLWSYALGTYKHVVVYLPQSYAAGRMRYPVAYYLHGLGGDETNWWKAGHINAAMDSLIAGGMPEMLVVMPDGDDSWWMTSNTLPDVPGCRRTLPSYVRDADTYCVPWPHYDDYVAYDLVMWVDAKFRTRADRAHRGIAGLSMGGMGAVMLSLQYPQLFAAAASHSGVLWPLEWAQDGVYQRPLGSPDSTWRRVRGNGVGTSMRATFGKDTAAWYARDPVHLLDRARAAKAPLPALKADIGTSDPFLSGNRAFRDALAARGVTLDYTEYPGAHDWKYWSGHVGESLKWLSGRIGTP